MERPINKNAVWTKEADASLADMIRQERNLSEIALELGRDEVPTYHRICLLRKREAETPGSGYGIPLSRPKRRMDAEIREKIRGIAMADPSITAYRIAQDFGLSEQAVAHHVREARKDPRK